MGIHSASIKSIVFAGATHRELDGKKQRGKKAEKGGKKTLLYKEGYSVPGVSKKRSRHSSFIMLLQPAGR